MVDENQFWNSNIKWTLMSVHSFVTILNECVVVFFFLSLSSSASLWNPPALMAKRFSRFLHEFCAKFSIIIALWHVHIRGYGADMLIKCIGSVCVLPLSFRISRCHTRHFTGAFFCTGFNWQPCYTLHTLEGLPFLQLLKNLLQGCLLWPLYMG